MTNAIRRGFHSDLAGLFANDIRYQRSNFYYFLGKIEPWSTSDVAPAAIQTDSENEDSTIRSNALFLKKISPNDISIVTKRYDWKSGTFFAKWDHTSNMTGKQFYCLTDSNIVYKCLDNNGESASTIKPTGTSYQVFRTSDGYLWKYMYTIPTFKRTRFTSLKYIPVQRALTDSFYNKGSIDEVVVSSRGMGYVDAQMTTITVTGDTTGSGATGRIFTDASGKITSVVLTNGGTGYTSGVNIAFQEGTGSGGVVTATISSGVITNTTIVSGGVGYVSDSVILFQVGGAVLVPIISRSTGSIESVKIINPGIGYATPPTLSVFSTTNVGSGKYGRASALLGTTIYQGKIVEVTIADPGINYPSDNDTTILVQGNGTGAVFSPVLYEGSVVDVVVENPGVGYTSIVLTVVGSGTGATVNPIVSASDFSSDQSVVEQTASIGSIYSIQMGNKGADYYSATTSVTIEGDGVGCTATPVVVGGKIVNIKVNTYGENYSYANVVISDSQRNPAGTSVVATAYVILPPSGGHGKDAVVELFGSTVAINSSLQQELFLGNILQDYRQFGLIRNPSNIVTGKSLDADAYLITYSIILDTVDGLVKDDILSFQGVKFRIVSINTGNVVIVQQLGTLMINPIGTMVADDVVGDVPRTYISLSIVSYPVANKYSGSLLYVSNESPFSFTENQGITIKTFLTF